MPESAEESPPEAKPAGRKIPKILLFVGIFATGIAGGGGLYWAGIIPGLAASTEEVEPPPPEVNRVVELDPLLVNIAEDGQIRYVRIGLAFGLVQEDPELEIDRSVFLPKVKDFLLTTLGKWKVLDLTSPNAKPRLKREILQGVKRLFPKDCGQVLEVYVTEVIVQ